ncbi:hypothetical protein GCM10010271_36670 [Streptomyces kurssanovii]|nr:hypothetical protein GCM10010271_36670 [Streptomyces kurssanovii]
MPVAGGTRDHGVPETGGAQDRPVNLRACDHRPHLRTRDGSTPRPPAAVDGPRATTPATAPTVPASRNRFAECPPSSHTLVP